MSTNSSRVDLTSTGFLDGLVNHNLLELDDYINYNNFFELDFANLLSNRNKYHEKIKDKKNHLIPPKFGKNILPINKPLFKLNFIKSKKTFQITNGS